MAVAKPAAGQGIASIAIGTAANFAIVFIS
jgi:hypothetical protein